MNTLSTQHGSPLVAEAGDWRVALPVLTASHLTLREVTQADARSLLTMMTAAEVARFITPPPSTLDGFERFINWAHAERRGGVYACYGVVPQGMESAIGLFQLRFIDPNFGSAEWGFVLGSAFWGSGIFTESAQAVLGFAFDVIGLHRVEARAAVANGRGNGALRKLGAVQEGVLRRSFSRNGRYYDQVLWSILAEDWHVWQQQPRVH